jgi:hypothetical protein
LIAVTARAAAVALAALAAGNSSVITTDVDYSSALVEYQVKCNQAQAFHDTFIHKYTKGRMGFTDGEAWRPQETAIQYAKRRIGIANSLHTRRLARDKNLVIDGQVTMNPDDYQLAGAVWEAIGKGFGVVSTWGGRFNDSVHFSCSWEGVK